MSLKSFHLFFIAVCLGLMAFLISWSLHRADNTLVLISIGGLICGAGYLNWFLKEYRALR